MTKHETTKKVLRLISYLTKDEIARKIGISRPTLDARLKWHTWKTSEIYVVEGWKL